VEQAVDDLAWRVIYPGQPTQTMPGSIERLAVYVARALADELRPGRERSLHVAGDRNDAPTLGILSFPTRNGPSGDRDSIHPRRGGGRSMAPIELLDAVDVRVAILTVGLNWYRERAWPREEDAHVYPTVTVRAELVWALAL
jgi:hypothetical protein